MIRVEVYGKPDCKPCQEAKAVLRRLQRDLPFDLVDVDITLDPVVERRYRREVPVVFVDGRKALKLRVPEKEARRRIERALTLTEGSERGERPAIPPRTLRRVKWVFAAVALLAAPAVAVHKAYDLLVARPRLAEEAFDITRIRPLAAPDFRVETRPGGTFSLADAKGQVLFVNFWATWCPPCREEMPSLFALGAALQREHPGRFRMLAVSVDEGWEPIREFFGSSPPVEIVLGLDRAQEATRAYYCAARGGCPDDMKFPESYLVDAEGRLVAYVVGPRDWSDPAARRFLERLISG